GFVDNEDIAIGEKLSVLRPLMLETGDRARGDTGTALQILGGNTRQSRAANAVTGALPSIAGHAQHGRLAGAGIAGDVGKVAARQYAVEYGLLLPPEDEAATPGGSDYPSDRFCRETMLAAQRQPIRCLLKPAFALDHCARCEPSFAATVLA